MAELTETNWKAVVDDLRSDILDTDEMAVDPNVHLKNIDSLIEFHTKVLEPNTRALDERVKEFREWIGNLRKWLDDPAMLRQFSAYGSAGASMAFGILRTSIDTQFPELFPAELKEKLKESEDGN